MQVPEKLSRKGNDETVQISPWLVIHRGMASKKLTEILLKIHFIETIKRKFKSYMDIPSCQR